MLDQEEHSAETEWRERGEVIKGRTKLDREMGMATVQNRRRGGEGQQVEKEEKK